MRNHRLLKVLDILGYIFLLLTVFAVPFFLDKSLVNFYIIPKQYIFIGLTLISLLLFAVKIILSKRIHYRHSVLDLPIIIWLSVCLLSSIFSVNIYDSFFGRNDAFVFNFIFALFLVIFYFLLTNYLKTTSRWRALIDLLVLSGGSSALLFILKVIFKLDLLSRFGQIWNLTDRINSLFGLWLVVIFILAAGQLVKKNLPVGKSLFYFFISILTFVSLVLLGFTVLWWYFLIGLVLLLLIGIIFLGEARLGWLSVLFALLILSSVFAVFGTPRALQSVLPAEVSLGFKPSLAITSDAVLSGPKSFLIGTGLGTFNYDFSKFRPTSFNYDSAAWSLRFSQPYSTMLSFVSEGGVVLFLFVVFIFLFVLGYVLNVWFKMRTEGFLQNMVSGFGLQEADLRLDIFLVAAAWVVLTLGMGVMHFGVTLWWVWWLLLGAVVVGLSFINNQIIKEKEWAIEDTPQYSLSFSFILIVFMAGIVMAGVWGAKLYLAEIFYAQATQAGGDYKKAEDLLKKALAERNSSDNYHSALAQIFLMQASEESKKSNPDVQIVSTLLASAVNEAKTATDLSNNAVALWENLSTMYENASFLVPEAREWSVKSLEQAISLEPSNPVLYWRLGNNYSLSEKWEEAIKNYEKAVALKKDYVGAYTALANAYEQVKQNDKAIEVYQKILSTNANNSELLFNYGRLLYNRKQTGDKQMAEKLWLEAIKIQPKYSNALYSLGLYYENSGDKALALQYFYKVKELNPDNKDVAAKIKSLVGAK